MKGLPCDSHMSTAMDLASMSVADLKRIIHDKGLTHIDCIEKHELLARALEAINTPEADVNASKSASEASEDTRPESEISDDGDSEPSDGISLSGSNGDSEDEDDEEYDDEASSSDGEDISYDSQSDELDRCESELEAKCASKRAKRA